MRQLTHFEVTGLLGQFNHAITLTKTSHVTILYGPNGVGKTKILEIINSVLQLDPIQLSRLPFEHASLTFSDGSSLAIK